MDVQKPNSDEPVSTASALSDESQSADQTFSLESVTAEKNKKLLLKFKKFIPLLILIIAVYAIFSNASYSGYEGIIKKAVNYLEDGKYYQVYKLTSETQFFPSSDLPSNMDKDWAIEYIRDDVFCNLIESINDDTKLDYTIISVEEYSKEDIQHFKLMFLKKGVSTTVINNLDIEEMIYVTYMIEPDNIDTYFAGNIFVIKEDGKWKIRW